MNLILAGETRRLGDGAWPAPEQIWIKEDRDVRWSLKQVVGYWLWWRNHRLAASEKGQPAMDFPEFLQWVRFDLQRQSSEVRAQARGA